MYKSFEFSIDLHLIMCVDRGWVDPKTWPVPVEISSTYIYF